MAVRVGFIGLGIMGSRMAANLRTHGYEVMVFNRSRGKADSLLRTGATWGDSPRAVAAEADVLVTMLAHPEAVAEAALGKTGFLGAMRPGSIWINSSTVNPSFARRMAEEAATARVRYLDAPVTGSKEAAGRGELLFMIGGAAADVETCRPLLQSMGKRLVHVGGAGLGSALKMVNNLLGGIAVAAFAEGAALGEALGVPRQVIFETLVGGPMLAPVIGMKRTKIEHEDYAPEFSMRWLQKDLHLASVSGYEAGVALPVSNVAKEVYRLAMRDGYADLDYASLYAYLHEPMPREPQPQIASSQSSR